MSGKPNIVFLFTDDQRFNTLNALGNEKIITPNMDRLINEGCTFTHAHIPGGTCPAVCMPSRGMINSGKSLFNLENSGAEIPADHSLLGETLRNNGYRTFGTGKWHNGKSAYHRSFTDGDEIFFGGMYDHWNVAAHHFDSTGKYDSKIPFCPDPMASNEVKYRDADHITPGKHSSELISDATVKFIDSYNDTAPFYMYVSFLAPHDPRTMPESFLKMYDDIDIPLPENFLGGHPFDNGELKIRDEMLADFPRDPNEIRRHLKEYYAMITHADHEIGKILKALEDKGQYENTIFVFAGDNGLALGHHGLMGKQNLYEHSVRVPLIFAGPGIPRNKRSDAHVYLYDIFPTLCSLTGISAPENIDGFSLAPAMNNESEKVRDSLYLAYKDCQRGLSDSDFKLIEYVVGEKHTMTQLFDLKLDPLEMNNLAYNPDYAEKVNIMREELKKQSITLNDRNTSFGQHFWSCYGN